MHSVFARTVEAAVERSIGYLLEQQDNDGFWREFELAPGAAETWPTAWVGWCLIGSLKTNSSLKGKTRECCKRAATAVWASKKDCGWGYNRRTGSDADTTAWALRFLSSCGLRVPPEPFLSPYIDAGGGVHTFRELALGAWTDAHDDVAANVGLALLSIPTARCLVERIQQRLVSGFPVDTYWWSTSTYGNAWTLRFLNSSASLSPQFREKAQRWLAGLPESNDGFEVAHRLIAARAAHLPPSLTVRLINQLLDLCGSRGWDGGAFLLVPPQDNVGNATPNPELRGLMTTALCVKLLLEWKLEEIA